MKGGKGHHTERAWLRCRRCQNGFTASRRPSDPRFALCPRCYAAEFPLAAMGDEEKKGEGDGRS